MSIECYVCGKPATGFLVDAIAAANVITGSIGPTHMPVCPEHGTSFNPFQCRDDEIKALIAEVRRLRAEIGHLRAVGA